MIHFNCYATVDVPGLFAEVEVFGMVWVDDGSFWALDSIDEVEVDGILFSWKELQRTAPSLAHHVALVTTQELEKDDDITQRALALADDMLRDEHRNPY